MLCTVSCNSKLELNHEVGVQVKGQKTSIKVMLTAFEEFYLHVSIVHKGITLKPLNFQIIWKFKSPSPTRDDERDDCCKCTRNDRGSHGCISPYSRAPPDVL